MDYCWGLQCIRCGMEYSAQKVRNVCDCGGILLAIPNIEHISSIVSKEDLAPRAKTMWRYRELLPIEHDSNIISLQEGWTPIIPLTRISEELGLSQLYLKDEGRLPTGTFKARGAALGISKANELGIRSIGMPTAGNAGGAWSIYGARAKMDVFVVMPADAPEINRKECIAAGAQVYLVKGLISDAAKIVKKACERLGWFDASTFYEPYRVEGKKTIGFEIAEQFGWDFPEVIICPCGGGVGIVAIWKAFKELRDLGWVGNRGPRIVAVQSEGCAPIVKAFNEGKKCAEPWHKVETTVDGLRVPKPFADSLILETLRESEGYAVAVNEDKIYQAMLSLARNEGVLACPEGAVTLSAAHYLKTSKMVGSKDRILLLNTGTGLKYPGFIKDSSQIMERNGQIEPQQDIRNATSSREFSSELE